MLSKLSLAAALTAAAFLGPQMASAATLSPAGKMAGTSALVQVKHKTHVSHKYAKHRRVYRHRHHRHARVYFRSGGRCYRWRRICASRHGGQTSAYYRCVRRHGC
jgi:hypothetical protein